MSFVVIKSKSNASSHCTGFAAYRYKISSFSSSSKDVDSACSNGAEEIPGDKGGDHEYFDDENSANRNKDSEDSNGNDDDDDEDEDYEGNGYED